MSWYLKTILSGSIEEYLQSLGATPDIIQYIISQGINSQILVNEFRKNPSLTIEQLQSLAPTQKEQINPYTQYEQNIARTYPEPMKRWILINLRKIRTQKEWSPKERKQQIHSFYMNFIDYLPQMIDWVERANPRPDISSYTPEQAMEATDEWHRMMAGKGEGVNYEPTKPELIVYGPQWLNPEWQGWTIQKVIGANDLEVEGNRMDHCVGSYCEEVAMGDVTIYSLRDPQNNPHITLDIGGDDTDNSGIIQQIQGKSNSDPKSIYKSMIKEWISTNGEKQGIIKEINTFENMEEYNSPSVTEIMEAVTNILQGESNEYGLKYIFDSDIETVINDIVSTGESENSGYRNQDNKYFGDIAESPSYITNLALMEDLKLSNWPRHAGEWKELRKMPKQSKWENIQKVENWAWETIDEIQEDFHSYETGLDYPVEDEYEDPKEYEEAMEQFNEAESEIHNEWIGQSIKGGFAKDLLDELKSFRESNIIPSSSELYEIKKKEQEAKIINSPAYQNAYEKGKQMIDQAMTYGNNWYKQAQQSSELDEILNKWRSQGITLYIFEKDDKIILDSIIVPSEQRKQGIGTQIMQDITEYADKMRKRIELSPGQKGDYNGTTSRRRLINFYKRHGLVENKGRNKDFTTNKSMYREPNELV